MARRWTNCRTVRACPGLIGVQQEWLRDLVEDYLAQQMRVAGAFRGIAHNVMASATETASENIDRMQQESQQMAEAAGQEMNRMADTAGQQLDQVAQDANTYMQPGMQHEASLSSLDFSLNGLPRHGSTLTLGYL